MKLVFDQNLSPRLVELLSDLFPGSAHVQFLGLEDVPDKTIWDKCRDYGFAIVTKDEDFSDMSMLRGFPPKVLWLQFGNCTTAEVESKIRQSSRQILAFDVDENLGVLVLR